MRGKLAKRLRSDARTEVKMKAIMEKRDVLPGEIGRLYNYKKKKNRKPLGEPKFKSSRRKKRTDLEQEIKKAALFIL